MPIFDIRGEDAREQVKTAFDIAALTSMASNDYGTIISDQFSMTPFIRMMSGYSAPRSVIDPPQGWRELTPEEIGLTDSRLDPVGFYYGAGNPKIVFGAQGLVFGEFDDDGNMTRIAASFSGMNSPGDVLFDIAQMGKHNLDNKFDYLFQAVKDTAIANGLTGEDVIVTGYSMGAGITSNAAESKDDKFDGFFSEADFIAFSNVVPYETEGLIHIGFENDAAMYASGDPNNNNFERILTMLTGEGDYAPSNGTHHLVLFDWPYAFYGANITDGFFNPATLGGTHLINTFTRPFDSIIDSEFYPYMELDSVIIISVLDEFTASYAWVEDRKTAETDHVGEQAFLLGTKHSDKIADARGDDFIEAHQGNDTIHLTGGNDVVIGGAGRDEVLLTGKSSAYTIYRLDDGTLMVHDTTGKDGLDELRGIERISFNARPDVPAPLELVTGTIESLDHWINAFTGIDLFPNGSTYAVKDGAIVPVRNNIFRWFGARAKQHENHTEGTDNNDTLDAATGEAALFGLDGDDTLLGDGLDNLLHGGAGDDELSGAGGNDTLIGSFGNDVLIGGAGNDSLSGGVGSDRFVFLEADIGDDRVTDFNAGAQGTDVIVLGSAPLSIDQAGAHAVITTTGGTITLEHYRAADLTDADFVIV